MWSCKEDTKLYKNGVRKGDILLCKMLSEEVEGELRKNCNIEVTLFNGKSVSRFQLLDWEVGEKYVATWLVYAGNKDLTGFLPQEKKEWIPKAKKLLEDLECYQKN